MERALALGFSVDAADAIVFLEGFSREAVKGERGHGAFEAWGRDAPGAMGTAPAGEVVPFDPDQAFIHTSLYTCIGI